MTVRNITDAHDSRRDVSYSDAEKHYIARMEPGRPAEAPRWGAAEGDDEWRPSLGAVSRERGGTRIRRVAQWPCVADNTT
jgi:hypothetical protein